MMTLSDFTTILNTSELPVAYLAFPASYAPEMPFITWQEVGSDNFPADNKVYSSGTKIEVSLFTKTKDLTNEALLESLFDDNDIFWQRSPEYDNEEDCYITLYELEI